MALGIAIFLGIKWNEPAVTDTADAYYREHNFQDFALSFPYGFTQEDIEAVEVAGCTALIVMSLSMKLSLFNTPEKHFSDVCSMDDRLVYDAGVTGAKEEFIEILDKEPVEYTSVLQEAVYIEDADGSKSSVNIIAPEEADRLNRFIGLRDWESGKDYFLPEEGALISRNYTKNRDVDVGDTIRIMDMKGIYHNCRIVGITDYYLPSTQLVMSWGYYEKIMSQPVLWEQPSAVYFH